MQESGSWPDLLNTFLNDLEIDLESKCSLLTCVHCPKWIHV